MKILIIYVLLLFAAGIFNSKLKNSDPAPVNVPNSPQRMVRTDPNDDGAGSIFFLDRHSVYCDKGEAMQGFKLSTYPNNKIGYILRCQKHSAVSSTDSYEDQTPWNDTDNDSNSSSQYLDRHYLKCKEGYGIQQFKFLRHEKMIRYWYKCVKVSSEKCESKTTP
jgi:hypothetical protein